jgi:hypothetical protein
MVIAQAGFYQCGLCGERLEFEPPKELTEDQPFGIGACANVDRFSNITGELLVAGCPRAGIRLKVTVQLIECEELKP